MKTMLLGAALAAALSARVTAQEGPGHILFGDFEVIEKESDLLRPKTFRIFLKTPGGTILRHQTVGVRGRYRFMEVPNGEYFLAVEANSREMVRIHLLIDEFKSTDLRHDLQVVWDDDQAARDLPAIRMRYARSASNRMLFDQAQAELGRSRLESASTLLEQLTDSDPQDFEAWTELGNVHFRGGEYQDAEECYVKALELRPRYLLALLNLGKLRVANEEYDGAVEALDKALRLDPRRAEAYFFMGEAHLRLRKGSRAVHYFHRALELDPEGMADAHLRMAALYEAGGYPRLAAEQYEQFLSKRPGFPERRRLREYIEQNRRP